MINSRGPLLSFSDENSPSPVAMAPSSNPFLFKCFDKLKRILKKSLEAAWSCEEVLTLFLKKVFAALFVLVDLRVSLVASVATTHLWFRSHSAYWPPFKFVSSTFTSAKKKKKSRLNVLQQRPNYNHFYWIISVLKKKDNRSQKSQRTTEQTVCVTVCPDPQCKTSWTDMTSHEQRCYYQRMLVKYIYNHMDVLK